MFSETALSHFGGKRKTDVYRKVAAFCLDLTIFGLTLPENKQNQILGKEILTGQAHALIPASARLSPGAVSIWPKHKQEEPISGTLRQKTQSVSAFAARGCDCTGKAGLFPGGLVPGKPTGWIRAGRVHPWPYTIWD